MTVRVTVTLTVTLRVKLTVIPGLGALFNTQALRIINNVQEGPPAHGLIDFVKNDFVKRNVQPAECP